MKKLIFFLSLFSFVSTKAQLNDKERIAIMDFKILGNNEDFEHYKWMSTGFSETLSDAFSRVNQFKVVERVQISEVLNEQKFQQAKDIDTSSIVKFGKILGVSKVLMGSCQIATGHMLVNMRIVNVETGEVYPIKDLPIITPLSEVLQMQKSICLQLLKQFNISQEQDSQKEVELVTTGSTNNIKAYEYLNRGIDFFNNHQYNEALQMYEFALEYDRKYTKAYYKRGLTNYALNEYEKAATDFKNSIGYLKKDTIYFLMGNAYYQARDYKKSLEFFKKAQKINPENQTIKIAILQFENENIVEDSNIVVANGEYETIFEFNNGRAKAKLKKKFGYIDTSNRILIPFIFDEVGDFVFGLAPARIGKKWGYINEEGKFVIAQSFDVAENFNEYKIARVKNKNKYGVIDINGNINIPIEFDFIHGVGFDIYLTVTKYTGLLSSTSSSGVYDVTGKVIIPVDYDDIDMWPSGTSRNYDYIHASYKGKWGILSKTNDIVAPFKYDSRDCIRKFSNGFAAVKVNERWGFVNSKGLEVIPPMYDRVNDRTSLHFEVKQKGKWGLIDSLNNLLIATEYDKLENLNGIFWAAKKGDKWGVIDLKNQTTCGFIYDAMGSEIDSHSIVISQFVDRQKLKAVVKKDGRQFWVNEKCECIYDCK